MKWKRKLKLKKDSIENLSCTLQNYNKRKDSCSYMEVIYTPYSNVPIYFNSIGVNYCEHCPYYTLGCTDEWMRSKTLIG